MNRKFPVWLPVPCDDTSFGSNHRGGPLKCGAFLASLDFAICKFPSLESNSPRLSAHTRNGRGFGILGGRPVQQATGIDGACFIVDEMKLHDSHRNALPPDHEA
jgi:hypothetical protein